MNKTFSIIIISLGIFLLLAAFLPGKAFSQSEESNHETPGKQPFMVKRRPPSQRRPDEKSLLSLTPEQKSKVTEIQNQFSPGMDTINIELRRKHLDMVAELRKPEPDRKKIEATLDEIMKLQKKRHQIILDEYFAVREILTPEQNRFFMQKLIRSMTGERRAIRRQRPPAPK